MSKKKTAKKKKKALKELSFWQLMRVRNALRTYHRYGRDSDGRYFTWRDVREAIALYTGVEIGGSLKLGAERLRQFVEGVEGKIPGEGRRFPAPQPKALEAIVRFVTHKELDLLSEDELNEDILGVQAPLRLMEFMHEGCTAIENSEVRHLEGDYLTAHPNRDGWMTRTVYLQRPHAGGLLQAVEWRDQFATESKEQALAWASEVGHAVSRQNFSGWAVMTPEDSLLMFLKREQDGKNHRYLCLEEVGLWLRAVPFSYAPSDSGQTIKILMMEHEFGHDLRHASSDQITSALYGDLYVFSKLSGQAV